MLLSSCTWTNDLDGLWTKTDPDIPAEGNFDQDIGGNSVLVLDTEPLQYEDVLQQYLENDPTLSAGDIPSIADPNVDYATDIEVIPKTKEQLISELAPKIQKTGITPGRAAIAAQEMYVKAEERFGSDMDAVLESYQPGQNPRKFLDGFHNAYLSGKLGDKAALENSTAAAYLTEAQSAFAFELGERVGRMLDPEGHRAGFGAEETYERNRTVKNQLVNKENADTILDEDMRISVEKLQRMTLREQARELDRLLYKYTDKESKWKGEIVEVSREELPKARGRKLWGCSIMIRDDADIKTKIHELLHARSFSLTSELAYTRWQYSEEAAVELFARKICDRNGITYKPAYSEEVKQLTIAKNILFPDMTTYDFAKIFFEKGMLGRYDWLRKEADLLVARNILLPKNVAALNTAVDTFRRLLINENSR